jgi:Flp pilus assembly protein TadD
MTSRGYDSGRMRQRLPLGAVLFFLFPPLPALSPSDYPALQAAKNVGLAALEEDNLTEAARRFETVRKLASSEPLGWADGAVAAMRARDLSSAARLLAEADRLSPNDPRVAALEGELKELSGDRPGAVRAYEKAALRQPKDIASRWSAARLLSEEGPAGKQKALAGVEAALAEAPANLFLLLRLSEYARGEGDAGKARQAHERLERLVAGDGKLEKVLSDAKAAAAAGDTKTESLKYRIVENLLRATPRYQQARHDVEPGVVGLPIEDWTAPLAAKIRARSAAGLPVTFVARSDAGLSAVKGVRALAVAGRDGRDLAMAGDAGLRLAEAGPAGYRVGGSLAGSGSGDVLVADVTNSGELDVVSPGALWVRGPSAWGRTALPPGDRVTALDFDADGDLDVYVSAKGGDRLVRNNLDGTWTDVTAPAGIPAGLASAFAVAGDFDRDGDVDLVVGRVGGGLLLLDNLRGGRFAEKQAGLPKAGAVRAAAAGDVSGDGRLDLVWTTDAGAFLAVNRGDGTFLPPTALAAPGGGAPLLFDFDNDGFLDLFVANRNGASVLLRGDGAGGFAPVAGAPLPPALMAVALDFDRDGDLDLALLTPAGGIALLENRGGNANGWIDVALEGLPTGSAKVNRFGFGSEIEVKAQELYAYRVASSAVTHVGLGSRRKAEVLRIVWTNGVPQNALDPPVRTVLKEVQQLKGSCPFLYAFDGERWHFVTDALGRSPAGLLYDGVHQAPADTREWLVVGGDLLRPSDGALTLDFTEELWETAYLDLAELRALDHPKGIEVVPDEKMVPPPFPRKALFTVSRPIVPRATDERGRDRTAEIAAADGRYLAGFAPTRYQGLVEPHDLVLELPQARQAKSVALYLTGWIFYADTSINVSLSQRKDLAPFGPVLELPDGRGGWTTAIPAMGYPAGKTKTMRVDLSGILDRADPRIRIRTNLAIYWDRICYTVNEEPAPLRRTPVPLSEARLFFRGFSRMTRDVEDGPQVFVHDDVDTAPRWADMAGFYTRFGDVTSLLRAADDRYVVLKGGDCVRMTFRAEGLPPLPEGWVRDWLVVLDGWDKDADKNTVAGQTVLPLPFHGMDDARYGEQPFPDSEEHRTFVKETLTRPGGSAEFLDAVRSGALSKSPGPPE